MNATPSSRLLARPAIARLGIVAVLVLVAAVSVLDRASAPLTRTALLDVVLGLILAAAVGFGYHFPVHIRYTVKVEMTSVPLYLIAVLLPPPLAVLFGFLAIGLAELSVMRARQNLLSDVLTETVRWLPITLAGSLLTHSVAAGYSPHYLLALVLAMPVLLLGDVLTVAIHTAAITGERYRSLLRECLLGVGPAECGQYVLGFTAALLAIGHALYAALLLPPIVLLYIVTKRTKELHDTTRMFLEYTADQVDSKDTFTHEHSRRVTAWTQKVLREMGVVGPEAALIATAARVHDIGKLSAPDAILHKHEELTEDEWVLMRMHPQTGAELVSHYPAFARGAAVVRGHHERYDGTGYPDCLAGTDIPFGARIVAVADSYDAMISDRPYRAGMSPERAGAILLAGRGTQWDPQVVDAFLRVLAREQVSVPAERKLTAPGLLGTAPLT